MGDRPLLERHADRLTLARDRRHEHRDLPGRHALTHDQPLDVGRHRLGLGALVRAAPERHFALRRRRLARERRAHRGRGGPQHPAWQPQALLERDHVREILAPHAASSPRRVGRGGQTRSRHGSGQGRRRQFEVVRVVDEHVLEPLRDRRPVTRDAKRVADQVAGVTRAHLGQHLLVHSIDLGELALDVRVGLGQPLGPARVVVGPDQVRLQPVDPTNEPREQGIRAPAEVVALDRQPVDPLEQHREPLGRPEHRFERVGRRPGAVQDQRRQLDRRDHEQLVVAVLQHALQARPCRVRARGRRRHQQDSLGATPLLDEPHEATLQRARFAGSRGPEDEQRLEFACDRVALSGKQGV